MKSGPRNAPDFHRVAASGQDKSQDEKDGIIEKQKATIRKQQKTIADLQKQIKKLSEAKGKTPSVIVGKRTIGGKVYEILGSGPNAGKLLTKNWNKVFCGGKWYKEWSALSEIKLSMGYTGKPVLARHGDMEMLQVPDGEHTGMFAQVVGGDSLYEFGEEKFIKWTLREEIVEEQRLSL